MMNGIELEYGLEKIFDLGIHFGFERNSHEPESRINEASFILFKIHEAINQLRLLHETKWQYDLDESLHTKSVEKSWDESVKVKSEAE